MNAEETRAVLAIALMAAYADGHKADTERDEVRRVAEALGQEAADLNLPALYQDVLLKRIDLPKAAAMLASSEARQLAFELAVGVCDADDLRNEAETKFLADLGAALKLAPPQMAEPAAVADALVTLPLPAAQPGSGTAAKAGPVVASVAADAAELDKMIVNASILNGALELLPQSMASMAIIPLQMRLVYRIGKAHGYELDRGHIKDLLAAMGVGLTGQYLEEIGRKLIGGLFGKVAGRMAGGRGMPVAAGVEAGRRSRAISDARYTRPMMGVHIKMPSRSESPLSENRRLVQIATRTTTAQPASVSMNG